MHKLEGRKKFAENYQYFNQEMEQQTSENSIKRKSEYFKDQKHNVFQNQGCKRGSKCAKFSSFRAVCVN